MRIEDIAVPEIYKTSADFRFFLRWFKEALTRVHHDTENLADIYDPLKCPADLLWMLGSTMGFKYDDRLPAAFNRLVLMYFMSMIRNRGSKDGVTLAAEVNLAQFNILNYGKQKEILYNRLEDTSIPVNSVYVTPHTAEGYIDVVYFSTKVPVDACIEYVRPLGMYLFQHAGVRMDAKTKISVDIRLTSIENVGLSIGPTHVGHYRREDYARLERVKGVDANKHPKVDLSTSNKRKPVWYRNSYGNGEVEGAPTDSNINPGYRALYSLQLCNNEHIFESLIDPIFGLGYEPQDVSVSYPDNYVLPDVADGDLSYNLRLDKAREDSITKEVYTFDDGRKGSDGVNIPNRTTDILHPRPAVNPIMGKVGDALGDATSLNSGNTQYIMNEEGDVVIRKTEPDGRLTDRVTRKEDVDFTEE